ncbi:MAG: hypothetical protein SWO11_22820, partial [Thermodesulfobacteriota bacterium]|nr:hypothetical protein [Thermodesulfobacteriota bacterium]
MSIDKLHDEIDAMATKVKDMLERMYAEDLQLIQNGQALLMGKMAKAYNDDDFVLEPFYVPPKEIEIKRELERELEALKIQVKEKQAELDLINAKIE